MAASGALALGAVASAGTGQAAPAPDGSRPPVDSVARRRADSLAARLEQAEAAIALLRQQLAAENASRVQTRTRVRLDVGARVLSNVFANSRRVNNVDVPLFALPDAGPTAASAGPGDNSLGLSLRQTTVSAAATVEDVVGATFDGDVDLDFFGRTQAGPGDRLLFPEPRLRTARATLRWPSTELMVGQETPLISGLDPASVASVGLPGFVGAGNLWNWLPQIRLTRALGGRRPNVALQGALLTPFSNERHRAEPDAVDAAERSGRPFVQARLRARWGGEEQESEVGVSAHRGWLRGRGDALEVSEAVAADAHLWLAPWLELRGEAYRGRLLRGLGGGGIGQNFGVPPTADALGPALRDAAGWAQLIVAPGSVLGGGAGCGIDDPDDAAEPLRRRNTVCAAHLLWRPGGTLIAGLEYRRASTRYAARAYVNDHLNLALGFEL